jgi:hypothetical protein
MRKKKEKNGESKKWRSDSIEVVPHKVSEEQYKLLLAELTHILYLRFCQLQKNSKETCLMLNKQKAG